MFRRQNAFTFHDVSINTALLQFHLFQNRTLHSTMFLLIRRYFLVTTLSGGPLHSTMFLLILQRSIWTRFRHTIFTFHDVSINTNVQSPFVIFTTSFTFHDVSINTLQGEIAIIKQKSLHSTMFLLIRACVSVSSLLCFFFTFHDVSINTGTVMSLEHRV